MLLLPKMCLYAGCVFTPLNQKFVCVNKKKFEKYG